MSVVGLKMDAESCGDGSARLNAVELDASVN